MRNEFVHRTGTTWLVLFLLMVWLSASFSYADSYSYDFTGEYYIWDISGSYSEDYIGCTIDYTISQDTKGKITGFGSANSCTIFGIDIDMTFTIMGTVKQTNGVCKVKMILKFTGTAEYLGETWKFRAKEIVMAEVDPGAGLITGTAKACVRIAEYGICDTLAFSESIPVDMDGSSDLDFDTSQAGRKLVGTGTLTLSNNDTYDFTVKGGYNAKKNQSTFSLKGDVSAGGCYFRLKIDENGQNIDSLKGKILGQRIEYAYVYHCEYLLAGDINNDCKVDFRDFATMVINWLIDCDLTPSDPACVSK